MMVPARVEVRVPASSANLGPGFDCLGLALGLYNSFVFEALPEGAAGPVITQTSAWGEEAALPADADNLAYRVFADHLAALGVPEPVVRLSIARALPCARGLGSSATAVVGGLLAAEAWAGQPGGMARAAGVAGGGRAL